MKCPMLIALACAFLAHAALADEVTVTINLASASGEGKSIGTIKVQDTPHGALLTPSLSELPPGLHGLHVHEHATCGAAEKDGKMTPAHAAGSHYDPSKSGKHLGPYAEGHLGDLPPLYVDVDGKATLPVLAPRLKVADLKGHSLMIHAGGDNYADAPKPLGGGGDRIACGAVK